MTTATISDTSGAPSAAGTAPPLGRARRALRTWIVAGAAVLVAALGAAWIIAPPSAESTDDAYVAADATAIAPKVRGLVAEVLVRDNAQVRAGDPLVRIDPEEFDARVATARAELSDAEAGIAAAQAALTSLDAEERLADANIRAADTAIASGRVEALRAQEDDRRYATLVASGAIAQRDADRFHSVAITAEQDAARSSAMLVVSRESKRVTEARRATLEAARQKADATRARDQAALDLALQDQRHTVITAPIAGIVGNRQVVQGDYVQPGTRLLTLVPLQGLYVTANFKETQTGRMHAGQRAAVTIDALRGRKLTGTVESLAPGSGSEFALLPFEPGTGNFTKIVQRVPVRIELDADQPDLTLLRPGLSVTARVELAPGGS